MIHLWENYCLRTSPSRAQRLIVHLNDFNVPLGVGGIRTEIKKLMTSLGYNTDMWKPHCLRSMIFDLHATHFGVHAAKNRGRWESMEVVDKFYNRQHQALDWQDLPARALRATSSSDLPVSVEPCEVSSRSDPLRAEGIEQLEQSSPSPDSSRSYRNVVRGAKGGEGEGEDCSSPPNPPKRKRDLQEHSMRVFKRPKRSR